jgi:UDP-N-acetylmuramoylalanine--D-glutamate ligase
MTLIAPPHSYTNQSIALIGYGVTGKACVNFLLKKKAKLSVFDASFDDDVDLNKAACSQLSFYKLKQDLDLSEFDQVVVSPGVNLKQPFIQRYMRQKGDSNSVLGDIELFARELKVKNMTLSHDQKPIRVIAVTGSNGKSTVVDMLTKALIKLGLNAVLGGNFGTSALSLIAEDGANNCKDANYQDDNNKATQHIDFIVLELSSFQLESTFSLRPDIACILNVTSDHLDRHGDMAQYTQAKRQIYVNAHHTVYNRDDKATYPLQLNNAISVGMREDNNSPLNSFYQTERGIYKADKLVLDVKYFPLVNQFQMLNMQVVLACAEILNMDVALVLQSLCEYKGLPHRFEIIHQDAISLWINDSKATNPGACCAAVESLSKQVDFIILIAGGDAKGADIQMLGDVISTHVDRLILMGKDAHLFTQFGIPFTHAVSIEEAVEIASGYTQEHVQNCAKNRASIDAGQPINDASVKASGNVNTPYIGVLLSPACASIDMFANYQERGQLFCQAVNAQVAA